MREFIRSRRLNWDMASLGIPIKRSAAIDVPIAPPKFRILSISGGGFMGFYTALVLAELEERAERPLGECFDLITGTSIGGIIALALARGVPMAEVVDAFEVRGEAIFPPRPEPRRQLFQIMDVMRQLAGAKYDARALRETIIGFLPEELTMGRIKRRVAIPAVNLSQGMPHTFRTSYAVDPMAAPCKPHIPAVDVALATSAAPTLLPIHEIEGEYFSDGGIYANSPDLVALHEAEAVCGVDVDRIRLLSVGTSSAAYHFPEPATRSFGLKEWAEDQRIVKVTLATQQNHARGIVQTRLGDNYLRIDEAQTAEEAKMLGLDFAGKDSREHLRRIAQRTIGRLDEIEALPAYLAHVAAPVRAAAGFEAPELT